MGDVVRQLIFQIQPDICLRTHDTPTQNTNTMKVFCMSEFKLYISHVYPLCRAGIALNVLNAKQS